MPELIEPSSLIDLRNLALAAIVGFLIGFEREWTHVAEARRHTFAGARTFALVGLVGGLAGLIGDSMLLAAVAFAAVAVLTITAYWAAVRSKPRFGGTTEVAIFAVFLLGLAATRGHLLIAAVGGVSVAIILSLKETVAKWAGAFTQAEVRATLRFLAISIIILPILPDSGYGPYGALNPREIWLMAVFISGLSFLGYWLMKVLGTGRGVFMTGLVGGLASSTATTFSLSHFAKEGAANPKVVAAGIIAANVVMIIRVGVLLAAVAQPVLAVVWPSLVVGAALGIASGFILWRSVNDAGSSHAGIEVKNPMELRPALIFAALLAAIALASRWGADRFGESALYLVGFVSGLADVDALTLTAGRQAAAGTVGVQVAAVAVLLAAASNILVKAGIALGVGGRAAGRLVSIAFVIIIAGAGAVHFLL